MKKYLFFIMLGCSFISCSKDNKSTTPPPVKTGTGKTYSVHFNVNATGSSTIKTNSLQRNTSSTPVPLSDFANILSYWVYDSSGALMTTLTQTDTVSNFGQISDTFAAGTYSVVFVAQNVTALPLTNYLSAPLVFSTGIIYFDPYDTFYNTFSLTVTNSPVTQNVTLQRVVGQLQVVITDTIPATTSKISLIITPSQWLSVSTGTAADSTFLEYNYAIPASAIGQANYTMTTYLANTPSTPFKVALTAYNSSNTVIATATIDSVTTQVNTRTLLSGNLFSAGGAANFTINFNDTWAGISVIPFNKLPSPIIKKN